VDELFLLADTNNFDDYKIIRSEIEIERTKIDLLQKRIRLTVEKFNQGKNFGDNIDEFTKFSNALILIQKKLIIENNEFAEKKALEKSLREGWRSQVASNLALVSDGWRVGYRSKEALYQYRDEKHLNEWLESIGQLKNKIINSNLQQEKKNELLQEIDLYKVIAIDMGDIVLRQVEVEEEKQFKIQELGRIVDNLEEDGRKLSKQIESRSISLARNTFLIIIIITGIGVILVIITQSRIMRSISESSKTKRVKIRRKR